MFATLDPTDLPNNPPTTGGSLGQLLRQGAFGPRCDDGQVGVDYVIYQTASKYAVGTQPVR